MKQIILKKKKEKTMPNIQVNTTKIVNHIDLWLFRCKHVIKLRRLMNNLQPNRKTCNHIPSVASLYCNHTKVSKGKTNGLVLIEV